MTTTPTQRGRLLPGPLLIGLLLSLSARSWLQAEEPVVLPDVLKRCQAALARLSYVEYTVKGTPTEYVNHPRIEMNWREEDKKLIYHFKQWKDDGTLNFQADYSYNGIRRYNAWDNSSIYETTIAPRPFDDWLKNLMFITVPFDFLLQKEGVPAWQQPNIKLLQDPRIWENLSKDTVVLGPQTYKNRACMVIRINHRRTGWQAFDGHYVVCFDPKNAMPFAWQVYDENNQLIEDDTVTSEQAVAIKGQGSYVAPKQIRQNYYSYNSGKQTRDMTWLFEFSDISTEKPPSETFELDLGRARQIHDQDANIYINPDGRQTPG